MATKSAEAFVNKIPDFINFMKELNIVSKLNNISQEKKEINHSHPLFGKTIVITGFRDNNIQEKIKEFGAKLGSSVSKNTSFVLVKNIDEDSGKISEAKKLGIPIVTKDDFNKKFL
jgi:NAD-dependent DNA ligase